MDEQQNSTPTPAPATPPVTPPVTPATPVTPVTPQTTPPESSTDLIAEGKLAMDVFFLHEAAIVNVAKRHDATLIGAVILCVPPILKIMIAFLVLQSFASPHYGDVFVNFIGGVLALFAPFYLARSLYGGQGDVEEYFRVSTYARFPHVLTIVLAVVPALFVLGQFLDFLITLWMLWVSHVILMKLMKIDEMDSFKVVGITFIGYLVIVGFLQLIF